MDTSGMIDMFITQPHSVYSARQPRHIKSTNSLHTYARCNQSPWELLCIYYELLGFLLLRRAWPLPINKDQTPIYQSIYHYHPKETHRNATDYVDLRCRGCLAAY